MHWVLGDIICHGEDPTNSEELKGQAVFPLLEVDEQLELGLGLSPRVDGDGLKLLLSVAAAALGEKHPPVFRALEDGGHVEVLHSAADQEPRVAHHLLVGHVFNHNLHNSALLW